MNKVKGLSLTLILFLFTACAGNLKPPKWVTYLPEKDGHVYAVGTEEGSDLQNAMDEAKQNAVRTIAQNMNTEMTGLMRRAQEEIDDQTAIDNFQSMQEEVLSVNVSDTRVAKQEVITKKNMYTVFVLVEYDRGAANKRLLQKLDEDKALYDAFRTSQLYDELKTKADAYRDRNAPK